MRELISTILHPTVQGLVFVPMIILYEILAGIFAWVPGKFGDWIWDFLIDIKDAMSYEVYKAISETKCFWTGEWFEDLFK